MNVGIQRGGRIESGNLGGAEIANARTDDASPLRLYDADAARGAGFRERRGVK